MSNDEDWVADVRRWVVAGSRRGVSQAPDAVDPASQALPDECSDDAIGYEAAHPVLQAAQWQDAPRSTFGSLGAV